MLNSLLIMSLLISILICPACQMDDLKEMALIKSTTNAELYCPPTWKDTLRARVYLIHIFESCFWNSAACYCNGFQLKHTTLSAVLTWDPLIIFMVALCTSAFYFLSLDGACVCIPPTYRCKLYLILPVWQLWWQRHSIR